MTETPSPKPPCQHEEFEAQVDVIRISDTDEFAAEVRVWCIQCGLSFRFPGLPCGVLASQPSVSPDETVLFAPLFPGPAKELSRTIRFEMSPGEQRALRRRRFN